MPPQLSLSEATRKTPRAVLLRVIAVSLAGSALLTISAQLAVPFWPVPMTMQTLVVLLLGAFAGPGAALAAVLTYVAEGLAGFPVFSHGGGFGAFFGPTFGYIAGFLPAVVVAAQAGRRSGVLRSALILTAADAVILACGVAWLATLIGWEEAVAAGLTPFVLGEALKVALATAALQLRSRVGLTLRSRAGSGFCFPYGRVRRGTIRRPVARGGIAGGVIERLLPRGARLRLVAALPRLERHAVDVLPGRGLVEGEALRPGGVLQPGRQAVAAEARKRHEVDVLHIGPLAQMRRQPPEGGSLEPHEGVVVQCHDRLPHPLADAAPSGRGGRPARLG